MGTGTKNGKHRTNNINILLLSFIVLIQFNIKILAEGPGKKEGYIIVIDPGHGGKDPGAIGSYSFEKNITLSVALKTGEYIEQNLKNVKVVYTRKTDTFVDLYVRSDIANKYNADLFISIHANANPSHSAYGSETYIMGTSKDQANLDVAIKENQVILLENDYSTKYEGFDPKSQESYIMFSLTQNAYTKQSLELADLIQRQYKNQIGRFDRGVQQAGFWVLYKTSMPSVLTEIGFITNMTEEKYINSKEGQDAISSSIFKACKEYITEISKRTIDPLKIRETSQSNTDSSKTDSDTRGKIIFMIQVATSAKKIAIKPENFKKIEDISELYSGNKFRYATGSFEDYDKAVGYRKKIETIYPDAFVIAVKDNKILPLREALDKNQKSKKK